MQIERMFEIIQMRGVDDQMTDKLFVNGTQITVTIDSANARLMRYMPAKQMYLTWPYSA